MIRFCDKEVDCISMETLHTETKESLMNYFQEETAILCIVDSDARYCGYILYDTLLQCDIPKESIVTDAVTLDNYIWKKARLFYKKYRKERENILLPVIDGERHLLCL